MGEINGLIDFKNPRQKMWGVLRGRNLQEFNFGNKTDEKGNIINSYSTNCYSHALAEAKKLIEAGEGIKNIQIVELVPYDFMMKPII